MKCLDLTFAAVGGLLVGAAGALLLAPQSGVRTRVQIRRFVRSKFPFIKDGQLNRIADEIADVVQTVEHK